MFFRKRSKGSQSDADIAATNDVACPDDAADAEQSPLPPQSALAIKAASLTTEDPGHSPTIFNNTKYTIVVFQDRGILFNQQILHPGEALSMTRGETGGGPIVPYKVHAMIGDESCLPTRQQSAKNLVSVTAIPAAFVAGCFATAASAGMLAGPSAALAPMVSGLVVKGVVIDAAALAAGGVLATRATAVSEMLVKKYPEKFACQSSRFLPGKRFLVVSGGLDDGDLKIEELAPRKFQKTIADHVRCYRTPMDTIKDKIQYYLPGAKKEETPKLEAGNEESREDGIESPPSLSTQPTVY